MTLARPVAVNPGELSAYLRLRFVESSNATPCRNQIIATSDSLTVSQTTSRAEKCQSNGFAVRREVHARSSRWRPGKLSPVTDEKAADEVTVHTSINA